MKGASRRSRIDAVLAAVAVSVALLGCNAVLGIRPALDQEWDGGVLADGAPAVPPSGSSGSTTGGSTTFDAGPIPDAGSVARWANWPMPNPPSISPSLPHPQSYDTSNAGVVIDTVTRLQWQATVDGNLYAYGDAIEYCGSLQIPPAGGGWRLPSRIELMSIVDNTQQPRIDGSAFPMPSTDSGTTISFWASSLLAGDGSHAWVVDFGTSTNLLVTAAVQPSSASPLPQRYYVRCVRGPT